MRDCAIISTRITELSPTSAPSLTNGDNQGMPMASMPTAIGSGTCSRLKGTTPVKYIGHEHIQNRADRKRAEQSNRNIAARIFCFLRNAGHGIETNIGEEYDRRAAQYAAEAKLAELPAIRRNKGAIWV